MTQFDFYKRIKDLMDAEQKVSAREFALTKRSAKFHDKMYRLLKIWQTQQDTLDECHLILNKMNSNIAVLTKFKTDQEAQLEEKLQRLTDLKEAVEEQKEKRLEQSKRELELMDCLGTIKEVTGTYINYEALPERVQGIALCEKKNSTVWQPFNIDPKRCTKQEVQNQIWGSSFTRSPNQEEWHRILFGPTTDDCTENIPPK